MPGVPHIARLVVTDFKALFGGAEGGAGELDTPSLAALSGFGDAAGLALTGMPASAAPGGRRASLAAAVGSGLLGGTARRMGAAMAASDSVAGIIHASGLAKDQASEQAFRCARMGRADELEDLLLTGLLDVNAERDAGGNTLLIVAAQAGQRRVVKQLLRRGADLNAQNGKGNTALHYCFMYNFRDLGEYLISKGADDTISNADSLTAHEASASMQGAL
jgi:hypothetical protein